MRRCVVGFLAGVLAIPVGVVVSAWLGFFPMSASMEAPRWEAALGHMALHSWTARHAPHLQNPLAATDENLLAGLKLFQADCAGCHDDLTVKGNYNPMLYPNVPQFRHMPPTQPEWQLFYVINHGVRYSGMFVFEGAWDPEVPGHPKSDQKIWSVVTFLSHINSLPPAVATEWNKKPAS